MIDFLSVKENSALNNKKHFQLNVTNSFGDPPSRDEAEEL